MNKNTVTDPKEYIYLTQLKKIIIFLEQYEFNQQLEQEIDQDLKKALEQFLSHPRVKLLLDKMDVHTDIETKSHVSWLDKLKHIMGPTKNERTLSKQRIELIERAEHAESTAFEALAEAAELKNKLEAAESKLKKLGDDTTVPR